MQSVAEPGQFGRSRSEDPAPAAVFGSSVDEKEQILVVLYLFPTLIKGKY